MKTVYLVSLTLVFLFLSVGMVSAADPATLYVDVNNGNDSNDGSQEHPWSSINHAADQVNSGDTVLIASGNYYITQTSTSLPAETRPTP